MLVCNKCNLELEDENFYKKRNTREKSCKFCKEKQRKTRFASNPQIAIGLEYQRKLRFAEDPQALINQRVYAAAYYKNNRQKQDLATRLWYKNHPEKRRESHASWRSRNRSRMNYHQGKRRSAEIQASPNWCDNEWEDFRIAEIYHLSELRTNLSNFKYQVDHIVPLQSNLVCGLHCADNLQILEASANISKGNRYWPGMW
jgi:hypothetical protein